MYLLNLSHYFNMSKFEARHLTTSTGQPIDDNQNSVTAGEYGPVVISDFHLIDKLAHFDR